MCLSNIKKIKTIDNLDDKILKWVNAEDGRYIHINNDIPIHIFKSHHYAIYPWSLVKDKELKLITIDYHTDTHKAFTKWNYNNPNKLLKIKDCKINTYKNIKKWITKLSNDEHIDFAIEKGLLSSAITFNKQGGIVLASKTKLEQLSIGDGLSNVKNALFNHINSGDNVILDIDMDFFQCKNMIDCNILENLHKVKMITIALEDSCQEDLSDQFINYSDCKYCSKDNCTSYRENDREQHDSWQKYMCGYGHLDFLKLLLEKIGITPN